MSHIGGLQNAVTSILFSSKQDSYHLLRFSVRNWCKALLEDLLAACAFGPYGTVVHVPLLVMCVQCYARASTVRAYPG